MIITPQSTSESAQSRINSRASYYDGIMNSLLGSGWSVVENKYESNKEDLFFKRGVTMQYADIMVSTQMIRRYINISNDDDPSELAETAFAVDGMAVNSSLANMMKQMFDFKVIDERGSMTDKHHFQWYANLVSSSLTSLQLRELLDKRFSAMFDKRPEFSANLGVYKHDIAGVWGYGDPDSHMGWTSAKASVGITIKDKIKKNDETIDHIQRIMLLALSSMRGLVPIGDVNVSDI